MDDYRWNHHQHQHQHQYHHHHVPAFGSWDYGDDDMPYTQCFERTRQAGPGSGLGLGLRPDLVRYGSYPPEADGEERDLYVAGDLYQNDVVTPAVILVPRRRRKGGYSYDANVKEDKRQQKMMKKQENEWGYSYDIKEPSSPVLSPPPRRPPKSKPVDEDLYKIPPEFLHVKPKRKRGLGLFSSCLLPTCFYV